MRIDNNGSRRQALMKGKQMFVLCLILYVNVVSASNNYRILTGMQKTNQTFMAYIPYLQSCNYTLPQISPGYITTYQTTPENLFTYYENAQRIAFWSSIENGLNIYLQQDQLFKTYDGVIYRPQVFNQDQNNTSINSTNDVVSLFNTFDNGNMTIYFVQIYVETQSNFTLHQTLLSQYQLNISLNLQTLIKNCNSTIHPGQQIVIDQLDNTHYIGTCLLTSQLFFFTLNQTYPNDVIIDLSLYNMSMPINRIILNPILQIFGVSQIGWNVFLLTNNNQQTYSCNFDPLSPQNFTCLNSLQLNQQFLQLIEKLWSEQDQLLEIKLQKLITHIGPNATAKFPGKINSIFIDPNDNIYVQSQNMGLSYLSIYDWKRTQILNISFIGTALIYNSLQFLIKTTQSIDNYSIMTVTLPLLSFDINEVKDNNSYQLTLQCEDGVENLHITYNLFMSNIAYPSAYTFQTSQPSLHSSLSIYTFQLMDYYTVFGPGYTVYFNGPDSLSATLLDASIISMNDYVYSIVEILVSQASANTIFKSSSLIYTTGNAVWMYSGEKGVHGKVVDRPCGIAERLKGVKINQKQTVYYGFRKRDLADLTYCLCRSGTKVGNNCHQVGKTSVRRNVLTVSTKLSQKLSNLLKLGLMDHYSNPRTSSSLIINRLFTIVDKQLVVTLYSNGSAILSNFFTTEFYDIKTIDCFDSMIVGAIFMKQFYDPSLLLFCQQSGFINQYKIRSNRLLLQRVIPLYGFTTRTNSATNLLVGNSYVFVQVDVDESVDSSINVNPENEYCCVLRIDPYADTVSSIKEVIFAFNIQQIYQYAGIDVAYYQGSQVTEDDSFIKIYLDQTWMALNLTQPQNAVESFSFDIVFASINYNLASQFSVNITYNLTEMTLVERVNPIGSTVFLKEVFGSIYPQVYTNTINFNYNGITGPILKSSILSTNQSETIQDIELNELIVQRMILGIVGNNYLQILIPMNGRSGTTFDQSIIVVGEKQLQVYLKNFNNQQMYLVSIFPLKYTNCQYFPYLVINLTTIQFVSECLFPQLNNSLIPIINLSLVIENSTLSTLSGKQYLGSVRVNLANLTNIKTIISQNLTYILGIDQGPMQSLTGKLQYCNCQGFCTALYISAQQQFLLYYDTLSYNNNQFLVVTLDMQYIQIWINPILPTNTSANFISPTYTISLFQIIDDNISIITLTGANSTAFSAVLSGVKAYYQVVYWFGLDMKLLAVFQRYGNCEQFDRFPVSVLLNKKNRIQALIAQCDQNQNVLRLQTYQRINSTYALIFTGYLQYYTQFGPLSNLGNSSILGYNPMKIIRLSNTMMNKLFLLYQNNKNQTKLVYQQIDGILADNYVYIQPSLEVTLAPLTNDIYYPTLYFSVQNDCYQLNYLITTKAAPFNQLTSTEMAFLGNFFYYLLVIFIVCNVFTLIVMVFFFIYKRTIKQSRKIDESDNYGRSWTDDFQPRPTSQFKDKIKDRISGFSIFGRKQSQMRKETQIELFTRRSNYVVKQT